MTDLSRYAACEIQRVEGRGKGGTIPRYVRLHAEPMHSNEVLPWLVEHGFVKRVKVPLCVDPDCLHEHCERESLAGWGSTYCAVPWDRSEAR